MINNSKKFCYACILNLTKPLNQIFKEKMRNPLHLVPTKKKELTVSNISNACLAPNLNFIIMIIIGNKFE